MTVWVCGWIGSVLGISTRFYTAIIETRGFAHIIYFLNDNSRTVARYRTVLVVLGRLPWWILTFIPQNHEWKDLGIHVIKMKTVVTWRLWEVELYLTALVGYLYCKVLALYNSTYKHSAHKWSILIQLSMPRCLSLSWNSTSVVWWSSYRKRERNKIRKLESVERLTTDKCNWLVNWLISSKMLRGVNEDGSKWFFKYKT